MPASAGISDVLRAMMRRLSQTPLNFSSISSDNKCCLWCTHNPFKYKYDISFRDLLIRASVDMINRAWRASMLYANLASTRSSCATYWMICAQQASLTEAPSASPHAIVGRSWRISFLFSASAITYLAYQYSATIVLRHGCICNICAIHFCRRALIASDNNDLIGSAVYIYVSKSFLLDISYWYLDKHLIID